MRDVSSNKADNHADTKPTHFIYQKIQEDLDSGKHQNIITRFPPEPNGYLHIGHAKAVCVNFGLAKLFNGRCYLRFDDTNPMREEAVFARAIEEDVRWLGFEWCATTHASDYYQAFYDFACDLIKQGLAYVDSLTADEMRLYRGTLKEGGKDSPYRTRSPEENLDLFQRMKAGEFKEGEHILRAKIDMQAGNLNLRDPAIYRIRHVSHPRTGDTWCIYPMYDFAHPLSDALEHITHSLCTLEFQDHRPLYDWFIEHLSVPARPVQSEFARLNISHTITSKRKLRQLVEEQIVTGWDDPRMPTLCGMRKRGYPAAAVRQFCDMTGVSKSDSVMDMGLLEGAVRDVLNQTAKRALCVLDPIKVVIENYPEAQVEMLQTDTRALPFSREIYIERSDFMLEPVKGYFRLAPDKEVRLRQAYVIRCTDVIYDNAGDILELRCTYDKDTLGKKPEGRKVKGVIHWVSVSTAHPITIYQYDRLFHDENPAREEDFMQFINHNSLTTIKTAYAEPMLRSQSVGDVFQFERLGYYCVNALDNAGKSTVFHRVVHLKDTWGKLNANT
ncbi:MAG: glutamine--tRNA ligase/YqeY domain fusion protein [Gammaproteobacteria bacterium]|nr:glutamine--tRNA ligase/YqeY domain fusion protein [Gammaproteobacteria bacterium]MCH9762682.1 glutamine--tRNA ligase/YqeY domain fusion protein [Gammaproteobacteria bacterium]